MIEDHIAEESLDPKDWNAMKSLAHDMVDDMFDFLENIATNTPWKKPSNNTKSFFNAPLPLNGQDAEQVYAEFLQYILPHYKGNIHPRFWSWVEGTGTPLGMMADMLASGMNSNVAIGDHAAMYVDHQVIEWSKEMLQFDPNASGILLSGATMANVTALVIARNALTSQIIRKKGLQQLDVKFAVYASTETHNCIVKAAELIGIGSEMVRKIEVNDHFQMDIEKLKIQLANDQRLGIVPICIVGNAGTVNTGAIDDLYAIHHICKQHQIWFHVDGAFGAMAKLVDEYHLTLKPIEWADSVAFDFHKWMYVNYEVACLLVKDKEKHRKAFQTPADYLMAHDKGLASGPEPMANYGIELSRGFKSLKVWMSIKEHGIAKYRRLIFQNISQARYLEDLILQTPDLALLAPVSMNIVCFRYQPKKLANDQLNLLNKNILMRLHEEGLALPSYTVLNGKYAIRVAITNHRSKRSDFESLVANVTYLGKLEAAQLGL